METIILAGGAGTRLRSVVSDVPKPMAPVGGKPFLEWLLDYWTRQKVSRFILAIGYQYEKIENHFGKSYKGIPIAYAVEKKPLGTGGGLLLAMEQLKSANDCLVLNGDTLFEVALSDFQALHTKARAEVSIALREVSSAGRYGTVVRKPSNQIVSFQEKGKSAGVSLINGGVYLVKPGLTNELNFPSDQAISFETEILPVILGKNKALYGFDFHGKFVDIGIPEDYEKAYTIITR